ncbi:DUF2997 domain-containing protein [Pseudarthrobacter sp. LT1]|uniref:DUF2997 domain-containing protein n=1 Tax=Pseudarthrobacter sp. LT1 TaxID=3111450 RepID=UPI002D7913EE|nr:DUF2997 domain-containing protein [Pseudarthrobacter sp. LT1]WRT12526.1 DUF2997 domain-containing protein [Pseudarthrobacter sp. LT1]
MGNEQLVVRISPDGAIFAETKGMKGPKCLEAIGLLEDLLEAQTVTSSYTKEYDEVPASTHNAIEVDDELRQH